jgi:Domain of unknown function (DUF4145)
MKSKILKSYCSKCRHDTNHNILLEKIFDEDFVSRQIKQTIECLGCENLSFRIETHDYWDIHEEYDEEIEDYVSAHAVSTEIFPGFLYGHSEIKNLYNIPHQIRSVYDQTILAFKGKSYLLAGVGFRAIIEAICIEENIRGSNLEVKINNLAKNRLITERESERLHTIRFLGNDSVHEMEIPELGKVFLLLDIVENLLKNLYILDKEAKYILDTIITDYTEFEDLLWRCAEKMDLEQEKNIKQILGKHIRRVKIDLQSIDKILVSRINSGHIEFLTLGKTVNNQDDTFTQFYRFTGKVYDDLPF